MARLLYRSKSTKEIRTKYELPDEGPPQSSAQLPPRTPIRLTRRRAGTNIESKQISPSKSIADLSVTVPQEVLVASPLLPEWDLRVASPGTSFPNTHGLYMESFLPRTSSRASLSSPSTTEVGIAIGSPTKEKHMYIEGTGNSSKSAVYSASASIPSFYLPPEPFDIRGGIDWNGKQSNGCNGCNGDQQETRGGWRKLFGRTLFGNKKAPAPAPAPHIPVVKAPLQPRHIHIPLVTAESTPTVNKHRNEGSQGRMIVDQKAKGRPSPQLLNVEIPTVEMERYSIMFRGLLREESPTKTRHVQKTSLHDRRRNDVLSGITSKERPKLQLEPLKRHATTSGRIIPSSDIPDSFSVPRKPIEAPKNNARLGRSNTTAALTRDPRPGPGFVLAGTAPYADTIPSVLQERKKLASTHPNLITLEAGRDSMNSNGSGGSVALSVNGSFDEGDDYCFFGSTLPNSETKCSTACEESPVMKNSPKSSSSSSQSTPGQSSSRQTSPRQTSPKQSSPMQSSLKQTPPRTEEELVIAAQQSIQRQISISQRQLLLPVVRGRTGLAGIQTPPESASTTSISGQDEPRTMN